MNDTKKLLEQYEEIGAQLARKWAFLLEGIKDEYRKNATAILLENTLQKINGEVGLLKEGVESSDVVGINRILLPIIRRVYPQLMANEFVTVQPMLTPTSQIFYLRYRYGASSTQISSQLDYGRKGTTLAGDEFLRVPAFGTFGINPYYSSQKIENEAFLTQQGSEIIIDNNTDTSNPFTKTLNWYPVVNGTIAVKLMTFETREVPNIIQGGKVITREEIVYKDVVGVVYFETSYDQTEEINATKVVGDYFSTNLEDHSYNPATRVVSVTLSQKPGSSDPQVALVCDWEYNLENNSLIPEVKINVETDYVTAKERKLKTEFTQEALQDLKALHNIDAEAELTAVISSMLTAEIDREILADLLNGAAIRLTHNYKQPIQGQTFVNYLDMNQALAAKVLEAASQIYTYGKLGFGNWCVTNPSIFSKLSTVRGFEASAEGRQTEFSMGITFVGTLAGRTIKVYTDPYFPPNKILVGFKGNSFLATSYVYAPYQPLYTTPLIYDPATLKPIRGFLTRYGKKLVKGGEYLLSVIEVTNLE
jgi:hypothetical protein